MSVDEFDKLFDHKWATEEMVFSKQEQMVRDRQAHELAIAQQQYNQARQAQTMAAQAASNQAGSGLLGAGLYGAGGAGAVSGTQQVRRPPYQPMQKLAMRLDIGSGEEWPFEHISAIENKTGGTVVIFVIQSGKPGILEDDAGLFPSDKLVAQLNLLRK